MEPMAPSAAQLKLMGSEWSLLELFPCALECYEHDGKKVK